MGNISCSKYRPPYKNHVRRVYHIKENPEFVDPARFKRLTQYARSSPEYLPSIGRYLLKQIKRDTVVHNTTRIEIGISALEALLTQDSLPLDALAQYVIQAIVLMFDSNSPELNIHGLKLLLAFITHKEYRNEHDLEKFYKQLKNLCRTNNLASDEICPLALNTLKEMLRIDDDESIVERLGEILDVVFENIADNEFRQKIKNSPNTWSATEEAARACFDIICLRTTSAPGEVFEGRWSARSLTHMDVDNTMQNFYTYERLMRCLISFLSSRMWRPQEFCVNIFLRFSHVAKHDPLRICESIASAMKQVPSGANRLEIQLRILTVVDRIIRSHVSILRHSHTLPSVVAKIFKQTITIIISCTEKGKNWPDGKDLNLDHFARLLFRCLKPMFQDLLYSDTLSLISEALDEWLKKAWNAESYYVVELILRLANCACKYRKPFPKNCSANTLKKVLLLILRFQSNPKLRLLHDLWRNVSLLSFQLIQTFLISTTIYRASCVHNEESALRRFLLSEIPVDRAGSFVSTILEKGLRLEVEECFKLPWFEEFRIYIYWCLYDTFCSNYLTARLAYSLHHLIIVVMSSDKNLDLRNILMFVSILEKEVEQKVQKLVQLVIVGVLIQVVREILRDAECKNNEEIVNKSTLVEKDLLALAIECKSSGIKPSRLRVNAETGLLAMVDKRYDEEDSTGQGELSASTLRKEPDNICELLKPLTQTPTDNQVQQWWQNFCEIHIKYKQGSSDEGSLPTHHTLTRTSGIIPKPPPSPRLIGVEDYEHTTEENGLENCKSFEDFIEVFTTCQKKNEVLMDELELKLRWENNLVPSIQPDDLVFDIEDEFAAYPQLIIEARRDEPSPLAKIREIRNLFGNKARNRNLKTVAQIPLTWKGSYEIAGKTDKVFSRLGLQELELERGLMSLDLRKEPIYILNTPSNRERRQHFLDEEDVKKGRLKIQVAKFIKKMKKGVQEKKYKSRRVKPPKRLKRIHLPLADGNLQAEEKAHYDIEIQMEEVDIHMNEGILPRDFNEEMQDIYEEEEDQDCPDSENDEKHTPKLTQCRDSVQFFPRVIHSAPCTPPANHRRSYPEYE